MNESIVIISSIVIIVLGSGYFLYKLGEYLYNLWTEYNTVDPTQADSVTPQKSIWESIEPHLATIANLTGLVIGSILKVSEEYRKQSYKVEKPDIPRPRRVVGRKIQDPNAYRSGYLKDPVDGVWRPTRVVNKPSKSPVWKSSDQLQRERDSILFDSKSEIDSYYRGRGSKFWTTEKSPKEKMDKHFKDLEDKLRTMEDVWDTKRR